MKWIYDKDNIYKIFKSNFIDGVIHAAGLKSVSESIKYLMNIIKPICVEL